jgi:exodeoxyribonuclease VII large subunit
LQNKKVPHILSVGELTRRIKSVLETDFEEVTVAGEISNFKRHSSGHLYFSLKDMSAQISCTMWKGRNASMRFSPHDGMKVIARGSISVYEPRGNYQLDCIELLPTGMGELQLAFEKLKQQLADEGLFDAEHKKKLPEFTERIGIVTSPTGAALQDMMNIISRRYPCVEILLMPAHVQGNEAAAEIANGIDVLNKIGNCDVIIVGRGGGSLEDLWAFNEEVVARAIFASTTPVISAVGHEIDFCISDFVADLRAPTPSAAAELVVPDRNTIVEFIKKNSAVAFSAVEEKIHSARERIQNLVKSYSFKQPLDAVRRNKQKLDELHNTLERIAIFQYKTRLHKFHAVTSQLQSLNPEAVLRRGYTIVSKKKSTITSFHQLHSNDDISIRFHDGEIAAQIQ